MNIKGSHLQLRGRLERARLRRWPLGMMDRGGQDGRMAMRIGRRTLTLLVPLLLAGCWGAGGRSGGSGVAFAAATYYVNGDPSSGSSDSNNCQSPSSACKTISQAIADASGGDTIDVAGPNPMSSPPYNGVYCEASQITIHKSLTLQAQDPTNPPTIDGGQGSNTKCTSPLPKYSVITVGDNSGTGVTVTLLGLTIQNGNASSNLPDANDDNGPGRGGGVFVYPGATLTIANSTISGNTGCSASCGSNYAYGGGVYNLGTLALNSSTVSGNTGIASGSGAGGGIANWGAGVATLTNSTISTNTGCKTFTTNTICSGGGIEDYGIITLVNSTVSQNVVCAPSGSGSCTPYGGGIDSNQSHGIVSLSNTILAGNFDTPGTPGTSPDCQNTLTDGKPDPNNPSTIVGDNIVGNGTYNNGGGPISCGLMDRNSGGTTGDQVGPLNGNTIDPKLAPLQNNAGPTPTMALLAGSPASSNGDGPTCRLAAASNGNGGIAPGPNGLDQRGEPRPAAPSATCDVGAFDTTGNPTVYVSPSGGDNNTCAMASAPCRHIVIGLGTVARGGTVNLAAGTYCEQLQIDKSVTLIGAGSTSTAIDGGAPLPGGGSNSCGSVSGDAPGHSIITLGDLSTFTPITVTLQGLTIQNGDASNNPTVGSTNTVGDGGGIYVSNDVTLTIANSTISGNTGCSASTCGEGDGGGIFVYEGSVSLTNSTVVSANNACASTCTSTSQYSNGGGIDDFYGTLRISDSTVSANSACSDSGCHGIGGGIDNDNGTLSLTNSVVSGNSACTTACSTNSGFGDSSGGGIYALGGTTTLAASAVGGNFACQNGSCLGTGGGIAANGGAMALTNTTVYGNTACWGGSCNGQGGGIWDYDDTGSPLTLTNSTVTLNRGCVGSSCVAQGGGILGYTGGGTGQANTFLTNSILAENVLSPNNTFAWADCDGATLADGNPTGTTGGTVGNNIVGNGSYVDSGGHEISCGLTNGGNHDLVGVSASVLALDPNGLQDNGGPTQTVALVPGSDAIRGGDGPTCGLATLAGAGGAPGPNGVDQRGAPRPSTSCDVGAYQSMTTDYVSPTGSDAGPCATATAPCQHIQAGVKWVLGGGTVNVAAGTYCEQLAIDKSVTMIGAGSGSTAIDGGGPLAIDASGTNSNPCHTGSAQETPGHSAVMVGDANSTPVTVTLQGLTIQHGDASNNPTDSNNGNGSGRGGGIYIYPGATLVGKAITVTGNTACSRSGCGSAVGGGIASFGSTSTLTLTNSTISGNTACTTSSCGLFAEGGGIWSSGTATVTGSTVSGNMAIGPACSSSCDGQGGGIYANGVTLSIVSSTVSGNSSVGSNCTSSCEGDGGGINGAITTLASSTVSGNVGCSSSACTSFGGGVYIAGGNPAISNSTISGNVSCSGSSCSGFGGGMLVNLGTTTLTNTTVSRNQACSAGSCATAQGGGVYNNATTTLTNTILAGNQGAPNSPDCYGTLSDGTAGNNIVGNTTGCTTSGLGNTDQLNADPQLDPNGLQPNGGPTQTITLQATSPAIGAGDSTTCQSTGTTGLNNLDQRGFSRHADVRLACDVGAYDAGGAVTISKGWNLVGVPLASPAITTASGLLGNLNAAGQLGSGTVTALATYAHSAFRLYVSGFSAGQNLTDSQGLFVLSTRAGQWNPWTTPGATAYTTGQQVSLNPGWNLVYAPYPYRGLNGDDINHDIGNACGLQQVAIYVGGSYQTYAPAAGPHGTAFHVPNTLGMWIECTSAYPWTP